MRRRALACALLPLLLAGCGGSSHHSSSSSSSSTDTIGPQIALAWPARARAFSAPVAATAAQITFPGAGANGTDLTQVVSRPTAAAAAVTQAYQLGIAVHPGKHLLRVDFLADAASTGAPLATATINVTVTDHGALKTLDGKDLGTVAYGSNVTGLIVSSGQSVEVGLSADLVVTATTPTGVAALTPGSVTLMVANGASFINIAGGSTVSGVAVGMASVAAYADGLVSSPQSVSVLPAPADGHSVSISNSDMVFDATRSRLWLAVSGGVIDYNPLTGAFGTRINLGASPTTLALSDDASTLYAGLQSIGTVRRVDLTTGTAGASFTLPSSNYGGATYADDIAVQPGSVSTLAIVQRDANGSGYYGPTIFDDGVARPESLGTYAASRSLWTSTSRLIAYPVNPNAFQEVAVDGQGATPGRTVATEASLSQRLVRASGKLYAANGVVTDEATLDPLGAFPEVPASDSNTNFVGPALDLDNRRAYFVEVGSDGVVRLHIYDATTYTETRVRRVTNLKVTNLPYQGAGAQLTLVSSGRLAFRVSDQVSFIEGDFSL